MKMTENQDGNTLTDAASTMCCYQSSSTTTIIVSNWNDSHLLFVNCRHRCRSREVGQRDKCESCW